MSATIPLPIPMRMLNPGNVDNDTLFADMAALTAYLAGPTCTPGKIVSVYVGENKWKIYQINQDKTLTELGEVDPLSVKNNGASMGRTSVLDFLNADMTRVGDDVRIRTKMGGDIHEAFVRKMASSLTKDEQFTTLAAATAYASTLGQTGSNAYPGQFLVVNSGPDFGAYLIQPNATLLPIGGSSGASGSVVFGYQSFAIGDIIWWPVDREIPTGWVQSNTPFSTQTYPALAALLGTNVTPNIPTCSPTEIGLMFGRYVDTANIHNRGWVEVTGPNQGKNQQLINAVNTIATQFNFEDQERVKLATALGTPATPSDDIPTLTSRMRFMSAQLADRLNEREVPASRTAPLGVLLQQIDDIPTTSDQLRITRFDTPIDLVYEYGSGAEITSLQLNWAYNDDALLSRQTLTGPGASAIVRETRQVILTGSPLIRDQDVVYTLTGFGFNEVSQSRQLKISFTYPIYYGTTESEAMPLADILLGTSVLAAEGTHKIEYTNISGWMYFATPAAWIPFRQVIDPHGFDYLLGSMRILTRNITMQSGHIVPYRVYATRLRNVMDRYYFTFIQ